VDVADFKAAAGGRFEAGNQSKQRALAASRGPDQYQELSILDAKVEMADRDVAVGIGFGESSERDRCHGLTPSSRRRSGQRQCGVDMPAPAARQESSPALLPPAPRPMALDSGRGTA